LPSIVIARRSAHLWVGLSACETQHLSGRCWVSRRAPAQRHCAWLRGPESAGRSLMHRLIYKAWIGLAGWLISSWSCAVLAEQSIKPTVLDFQLTCDPGQCRTPVLEIHEDTGAGASSFEYVFAPPPGITFNPDHATGVEVDGGGDTHYVLAVAAGPHWVKCKWLAKARPGGDKGLAKGYCWIEIKK
jgi:hypothetical protein